MPHFNLFIRNDPAYHFHQNTTHLTLLHISIGSTVILPAINKIFSLQIMIMKQKKKMKFKTITRNEKKKIK